ncbi:MAG: CoB--CoM heterodisulfide reductase iron-sulfur subunit A family (seleno)protein, partial [Thermodesulfobacteriota bacterium]
GFCCMHAIKEAIIAREHDPEVEVFFLGMDVRATGKGFEEYRNRGAREAGIRFIRGRAAEVVQDGAPRPVVWYEDTRLGRVMSRPADLVVLATACLPARGAAGLARVLGIERDEFGFFKTSAAQPLDTTRPGVFTCGCAGGPMDIPESVAQASSAAARAAQVLAAARTGGP